MASSKEDKYRKVENGGFQCLLCKRTIKSKQNIMLHLHKVHNLTPVKRIKKLYLEDDSVVVPASTLARWKTTRKLIHENNEPSNISFFGQSEKTHINFGNSEADEACLQLPIDGKGKTDSSTTIPQVIRIPEPVFSPANALTDSFEGYDDDHGYIHNSQNCQSSFESEVMNHSDVNSESMDTRSSFSEQLLTNIDEHNNSDQLSASDLESDPLLLEAQLEEDSNISESICTDSDTDKSSFSCIQSDLDTLSDTSSEESVTTVDSDLDTNLTDTSQFTEQELQSLNILSCFLRNNISASACRDILSTMKSIFPKSDTASVLDFGKILSFVDNSCVREVHYCVLCNEIFPENIDEYRCGTENCSGLRYKGSAAGQLRKERRPRQCFVFSDVKNQLKSLLQTPGIWEDIKKNKEDLLENKTEKITDITCGKAYQELLLEGGFLFRNSNGLTATFNTDGVNLYSSSKIELWPIFMVVNELSPAMRFARDNMILAGIWQGKGKPPFQQYLKVFSDEMNFLFNQGIDVQLDNDLINIKLAVICGIADLPAKAEVLNMTYFNGQNACITCYDPGTVVKQGKGTARCFPYRIEESRYDYRSHDDVITYMQTGTKKKPNKGLKGISGLSYLESYDLVKGTVPDYMHGILLGITKTLLNKWFSPSHSNKDYFIGNHLQEISKRLQCIKPPNSIERLPRDLEKHYNHFKATELQTWLLYYCLPCVNGILPEIYMENLACLSEAIYILLGTNIPESSLHRADYLLKKFYSTFQSLYGDGSCGLNVHNAGAHLVHFVKLWGPLWAWSCFPFEDANAMLLQSIHGTGIVLKQIMRYRQALAHIRRKGLMQNKTKSWKITFQAENCDVAGGRKPFKQNELCDNILEMLNVNDMKTVKKVDRIMVNGQKYYSSSYTRMQKRTCNIVLYDSRKIGSVKYFVLFETEKEVYAVIQMFDIEAQSTISHLSAGKHMISVKSTDDFEIVPAEKLDTTLIYIQTTSQEMFSEKFVIRMPNSHGHAVFK